MHSFECIPLAILFPPRMVSLPIYGGGSGRGSSSYSALRVKRLKSVTVRSLSMLFKY